VSWVLAGRVQITIDGPAGSGKSTVAEKLAARLGIAYLDTGAMYRAVTLAALGREVSLDDAVALTAVAERCRIEFSRDEGDQRVWLDGEDVTRAIRSPEVTENAHKVASLEAVRALLVKQQRRIAEDVGSLVTEGRDQGTVVFPEAAFKFYLEASAACRARRRQEQLAEQGTAMDYEVLLRAQQQRDERDAGRRVGPMVPADDARVVDTSEMSIEEVVEFLYECVGGQTSGGAGT